MILSAYNGGSTCHSSPSGQARWTIGGRAGEHPRVRRITAEHESLGKAHGRSRGIMMDHRRQLIRNQQVTRSSRVVGSNPINYLQQI
jgi:hypothetical protein